MDSGEDLTEPPLSLACTQLEVFNAELFLGGGFTRKGQLVTASIGIGLRHLAISLGKVREEFVLADPAQFGWGFSGPNSVSKRRLFLQARLSSAVFPAGLPRSRL